MPLTKIQAQPGFQSLATQVQAGGAWYAGNMVRWRFGFLEKWGGWKRLFQDPFASVIRKMHAWLDLENHKNLFVATDLGLQIAVQDTVYTLGRQTNATAGITTFSVANGSQTVTVKTTIPVTVPGAFILQMAISIGGRILSARSIFPIKSVNPGVSFTFDMPQLALYAETDVPGIRLFTNDFVNGMTVTWKNHGYAIGDGVEITQTTSISDTGIDFTAPTGTVIRVDTVPTVDTFRFSMDTLGTGDGTGKQVYEGTQDGVPGNVIGVALPGALMNPQRQTWFLQNLGQNGLVLHTHGPLEVYTPPIENGPYLTPVGSTPPVSAPQHSNGMLVAMPQAQVILWGTEALMGDETTIDPLLIRFSDAGTYDKYTATVSNQAGSYRLSRGSKIMGAIQAPQTTLIFTDTDVWSMSYVGPPLIYGFTIMGTGCGLIAPNALISQGRTTLWLGKNNVWSLGDTGAQIMPCSVWDFIFEDIDEVNVNKIFAASNSSTAEVSFYFPSQFNALAPGGDPEGNLLRSSQDFMGVAWHLSGARIDSILSVRGGGYVYEPMIPFLVGWFDPDGIPWISWWDRDLQSTSVGTVVGVIAPDGTGSSTVFIELDNNGMHSLTQRIDKQGTRTTYTLSVYAHATSTRNLTLRASTSAGSVYATFNVQMGQVLAAASTSSLAFDLISAKVVRDGFGSGSNGWLRYTLTFVSDDGPTLDISLEITNGLDVSYQGTGVDRVFIWGAQLVFGSDPKEYDPTTAEGPAANECGRYIKVNLVEPNRPWDSGIFRRTAWIDNSIWGTPLGGDRNNLVQQHEIGFDDDGQPMRGVFAETGYSALGDGTMMMSINQCQPDFKWFGRDGGIRLSLRAANYPGGPSHLYGPFSMTPTTQFICPRVRTRYVAVRYEWEALPGFSARVGTTGFLVKPAGRRP